jgi:CpeT protein
LLSTTNNNDSKSNHLMYLNNILLLSAFSLLFFSCPKQNQTQKEANILKNWMTGTFSSAEQAAQDSAFLDISLIMFPIWERDKAADWLYVEQAVAAIKNKPYRQRIYRITTGENGEIESRVYSLPDAPKFINAWEKPEIFATISPDSLFVREGCAVFLEKVSKTGGFKGATKPNTCISNLRGAAFATSEVEVYADKIISWDRGWNAKGRQVWGSEKGGYVFKKLKP